MSRNKPKRGLPAWMTKNGTENQYTNKRYLDYHGKINLFTDYSGIDSTARDLLCWLNLLDKEKIPMGFDMEWPFTYSTGPGKTALIQLCTNLDVCFLFQVYCLKELPKSLITLLQHEKLILHGVCIKNDIRKLKRDFPEVGEGEEIMIRNCIELSAYMNQVFGIRQSWSMAKLGKELLKIDINKDPGVRMSEWHKPLDEKQKMYAAIDVYASQLMYLKLKDIENQNLEKEILTLEEELLPSLQKDDDEEIEKLEEELFASIEQEDNETKQNEELELQYNRIQELVNRVPSIEIDSD